MTAPAYGVITRKGQITIPADIRRKLGLEVGDRVEIRLAGNGSPEVVVKRAGSLVEALRGGLEPRAGPIDLKELRRQMEEEIAEAVLNEGRDA